MTVQVCVSILPKTLREALSLVKKAEMAKADFIEVRLDHLKNRDDLSDLASIGCKPKIATDKAVRSEIWQHQMLLGAAKSGFEYVDIELSAPAVKNTIEQLKEYHAKPIVSFHKFSGSLDVSEMKSILEEEISVGAEVCKIVTTARQIEDNLTTLRFVSEASNKASLICFCMGELGKISRLLSPLFGGFLTFAALESRSETASGQMAIQEMKKIYSLLGQE